jgi:hypothetical protein
MVIPLDMWISNDRGQPVEELKQDDKRGANVVASHAFLGMMALATGAAQEEHRHWCDGGHHGSIVTRAADKPSWGVSCRIE